MDPANPSEETAPSDLRPDGWRAVAGRFLVVAGLSALAIAQPVLDLLGGSPSTFQVNRIEGSEIVVFALGVVLLPPLLLWGVVEVIGLANRGVGWMLHIGLVGLLAAMFGVLTAKEFTGSVLVNAVVGVVAGVVVAVTYSRVDGVGTWLRMLSVANFLFLAQFVFVAPVSDWIDRGTQQAIDLDVEFSAPPPPVVMLVFDEWPTRSILTADEHIDDVRFPNLAAFAEDSTWYRHFSTVSPFTQSAVPALLDGLDPHGQPIWNDHPDNLFSLLAGSHHLTVAESITQLCGLDACGVYPVPPPEPGETEVADAPTGALDTSPRWGRVLDSTWTVWTERVTPGAAPPSEDFDDFVEQIDTVDPTPTVDANAGLTQEQIELERFVATLVDAQPTRHELFVDALRPSDEPFFAFLHLLMPHQPWMLRENGVAYDVAADRFDYNDTDDLWPVKVYEQRHLLQAEYADRLLGVILDRLKEIDEYDESLIVVVADHGVALTPGEPSRRVTDGNLEPIAYSPLLIKAPGQEVARIDDSNMNSTDVTPTVADLLGITVPWETDGSPAGSAAIAARGDEKYIHSFTDAYNYEFLGVVDFDDDVAYRKLRANRVASISADDDRLAGLYRSIPGSDLIGSSADDTFAPAAVEAGEAEVEALNRLLDPADDGPLLGEIAGRIIDPPPGSTVIVAVDDRIVGVSPLYTRGGQADSFVVLLPADALARTPNTVRVAVRDQDGTVTEVAVTSRP